VFTTFVTFGYECIPGCSVPSAMQKDVDIIHESDGFRLGFGTDHTYTGDVSSTKIISRDCTLSATIGFKHSFPCHSNNCAADCPSQDARQNIFAQ